MALKDLAADLENFKYGISSPDRIDGQIESGVDFFDNETGGADGFTPKTDLESLYHKVQNATFGPVGGGVDTYANLNPITPFRSIFELDQNGFPVQPGEDDPLITLNIDNNVLNTVPQLPNAFGSDFMTTPLEGYVSRLPNDVFNDTPNTSLYSQTFTIDTDTNLFSQQNNFLSPNVANAFGSDFMTTPIGGAFSKIDDRNTLTSRVGDEIFDDTHRIPNAAGSDFMTTPILDRLTSFSDPSDSLTLSVGDVDFNNDPRIPNARRIGNTISPLADIVGINTGISSFPASNPDISSPGITFNPILSPVFDPNQLSEKQRGTFDSYPLGNATLLFQNLPLTNRYFNEFSLTGIGVGKSIHISPDKELRAGLRYGAMVGQTFEGFDVGTEIEDNLSSTWEDIPQPVNIFPIEGRQSQYTIGDNFTPSVIWELEGGLLQNGLLEEDSFTGPSEYNPTSPTPYGFGRSRYDAIRNDENILEELKDTVDGFKNKIDDLYEFNEDGIFGMGNFTNVPAGLSTENLFSTANYRNVANKGPFSGLDNHPLILRDIGNNWGFDPQEGEVPGFLSTLGGSVVRGAPGITGLIDRNLTDKKRLAKFLFSTNTGFSFIAKQFAFQYLNPDKGTIVYNPTSVLGLAGIGDIVGDIRNEVSNLSTIVGNITQAAASAVLPIGHAERHLGGYRYENDVSDVNFKVGDVKSKGFENSRLGYQSWAFSTRTPIPPEENSGDASGFFEGLVKSLSSFAIDEEAKPIFKRDFTESNPNRYSIHNFISTAPQSIGSDGTISFIGGPTLAQRDIQKALDGITFNKQSNEKRKPNNSGIMQEFSTLSYERLGDPVSKYHDQFSENIAPKGPKTFNAVIKGDGSGNFTKNIYEDLSDRMFNGSTIVRHLGVHNGGLTPGIIQRARGDQPAMASIAPIKGDHKTDNVDRINILPLISGEKDNDDNDKVPEYITNNPDFIKFMFKDAVNNKYLVFRAILDGISDTITPEFNEEKYLGRPDKLYTYSGTERNISFNFKIYPKTKQELPVLMEKLNYLVGMCYPSYTETERMISPYIELTIGDMFNKAPGLLGGLTVTVEDETTWETDEKLQFPHFISCACEFKYIGGKQNIPVSLGKHYDIPWLKGDNRLGGDTGAPIGTFKSKEDKFPNRQSIKGPEINSKVPEVTYDWINDNANG